MSLFRIAFVALVALVAAEVSGYAAAPVHLSLQGVRGESVCFGSPEQARTTIVYFMSRRAKEESSAFARAVDEVLLNAPVESVGAVDLRRYAGMLRRLATSYLRKSGDEALAHRRERRVAKGIDASDEVVNRWHLIGDFDGSLFGRFGVESDPPHPLAFVLDRAGAVQGPFRDVQSLVSAVRDHGIASPSQAMPSK
jgi:hypothetical protein